MNKPNTPPNTPSSIKSAADELAESAQQTQGKLAELGSETTQAATAALGRVTDQVEDMARRTLERARQTSAQMKEQFGRASDATVGYIKDEPIKAVLIAAATGAAAALLVSWLQRSRSSRSN